MRILAGLLTAGFLWMCWEERSWWSLSLAVPFGVFAAGGMPLINRWFPSYGTGKASKTDEKDKAG